MKKEEISLKNTKLENKKKVEIAVDETKKM